MSLEFGSHESDLILCRKTLGELQTKLEKSESRIKVLEVVLKECDSKYGGIILQNLMGRKTTIREDLKFEALLGETSR